LRFNHNFKLEYIINVLEPYLNLRSTIYNIYADKRKHKVKVKVKLRMVVFLLVLARFQLS
jgi:hypothetical protein